MSDDKFFDEIQADAKLEKAIKSGFANRLAGSSQVEVKLPSLEQILEYRKLKGAERQDVKAAMMGTTNGSRLTHSNAAPMPDYARQYELNAASIPAPLILGYPVETILAVIESQKAKGVAFTVPSLKDRIARRIAIKLLSFTIFVCKLLGVK